MGRSAINKNILFLLDVHQIMLLTKMFILIFVTCMLSLDIIIIIIMSLLFVKS